MVLCHCLVLCYLLKYVVRVYEKENCNMRKGSHLFFSPQNPSASVFHLVCLLRTSWRSMPEVISEILR